MLSTKCHQQLVTVALGWQHNNNNTCFNDSRLLCSVSPQFCCIRVLFVSDVDPDLKGLSPLPLPDPTQLNWTTQFSVVTQFSIFMRVESKYKYNEMNWNVQLQLDLARSAASHRYGTFSVTSLVSGDHVELYGLFPPTFCLLLVVTYHLVLEVFARQLPTYCLE